MRVQPIPSFSEIRARTEEKLGKRPCLLQMKVCRAFLEGDKHIVCSAATGFGKTLTFFMPLLFSTDGIIVIVTALNILGKQNIEQLAAVGISGIAISSENATEKSFKVCLCTIARDPLMTCA